MTTHRKEVEGALSSFDRAQTCAEILSRIDIQRWPIDRNSRMKTVGKYLRVLESEGRQMHFEGDGMAYLWIAVDDRSWSCPYTNTNPSRP